MEPYRRPLPQPDRSDSSWEKARTAAENLRFFGRMFGIRGAGLYTGGLCVAVPPEKARRDFLPFRCWSLAVP